MKNVISKTGQSWKFKAMCIVLVLSAISMAYGQMNIDTLSSKSFFYFVAGGALIGLFSFIFACATIKCPSCGSKWFWLAVSGKGDKEWLFWLNSLESCPKCGEPNRG
jgi:H+/Cl- antiporter ClcA